MHVLNNRFRTLTAALAIGALGLGFATAASATATYDALASFDITLTGVTDAGGNTVDSNGGANWYVDAEGFVFNEGAVFSGDAFGEASTTTQAFAVLDVGDSAFQASGSSGWATDGSAESFAETDLGMSVENRSGQSLTFNFDYEALVSTLVSGSLADGDSATADASVDVLDDLGFVNILLTALSDLEFGPLSDDSFVADSFSFTLLAGELNFIEGLIDTSGSASATAPTGAPEPASIALLAAGLIGVGAARRRKAA